MNQRIQFSIGWLTHTNRRSNIFFVNNDGTYVLNEINNKRRGKEMCARVIEQPIKNNNNTRVICQKMWKKQQRKVKESGETSWASKKKHWDANIWHHAHYAFHPLVFGCFFFYICWMLNRIESSKGEKRTLMHSLAARCTSPLAKLMKCVTSSKTLRLSTKEKSEENVCWL